MIERQRAATYNLEIPGLESLVTTWGNNYRNRQLTGEDSGKLPPALSHPDIRFSMCGQAAGLDARPGATRDWWKTPCTRMCGKQQVSEQCMFEHGVCMNRGNGRAEEELGWRATHGFKRRYNAVYRHKRPSAPRLMSSWQTASEAPDSSLKKSEQQWINTVKPRMIRESNAKKQSIDSQIAYVLVPSTLPQTENHCTTKIRRLESSLRYQSLAAVVISWSWHAPISQALQSLIEQETG